MMKNLQKNMLSSIIDERVKAEKEAEVRAEKEAVEARLAKEREIELEKFNLQLEVNKSMPKESVSQVDQPKFDLSRILPKFNPKEDEIGLYLTMFERQLKFVNI
ncbi:hypothetical protein X975_04546, partial [Stegodyphus mimosarum]